MTEMISFPHLGITLKHVGQFFQIGNFQIAFYGCIIALGMLAGVYLAMFLAKQTGQDPDLYFNFAIIAIVLSVIGARVYYVVFSWDYYSVHPLEVLNFRGGGLAIYGGIITAIITAVIYSRIHKLPILQFIDTGIPCLALGQAIGRWGNFFNREAFGEYTDSLFAMQLPVQAVRADQITEKMRANLATIDGISFIQVHPTFLYESIWNLCLVAIMLFVILKIRKSRPGTVFLIYLIGYGAGRFWIESLRTDQLLLPGTGLAVSQVLSAVLVIGAGAAVILRHIFDRQEHRKQM